MSERLLEVGISAIHENGRIGFSDELAESLVRRALRSVDTARIPVRCALLLATADWCAQGSDLPGKVREQFKAQLGYEVPLIGGSMAVIYCSTEPTPVIREGLLLVAFCSEALWVSVGCVRDPYSAIGDRERKLEETARELEKEARDRLGASAERYLLGFLPGVISDARGKRAYHDNELHEEILAAFGYRYRLIGASAADQLDPKIGYQFADDECLTSGFALALVQSDISTGTMLAHGFEPLGDLRVSVDALVGGSSSGYEVTVLDGKPAAERLRELRDAGVNRLGKPVFGLPCGSDFNIIWPLDGPGEGDASVRLERRVARGDRLCLLAGTPEQLLKAGVGALKTALARSTSSVDDLRLVLGFLSVGSLNYYDAQDTNLEERLDQLRKGYPGIPLVGALGAGEFGVDGRHSSRANNLSISVTCLTDRYSRRARTRSLQSKLLRAASRLSTYESPAKVMEAALRGAVDAGATGGKISLVAHAVRRILGKEFGYAFQPPLSPQDWSAVSTLTDRPVADRGGSLPPHLRDSAMPVVSDLPFQLDFNPAPSSTDDKREDILTLIVRTLHAVFIRDARDPQFYCDKEAVATGNLICFLAIPLVGTQLRVIATLQVSFPDGTRLDRESLAMWVSYAQKIAGALERAQEAEERSIIETITSFGNGIMHRPVSRESTPYLWCHVYLDKVVRLLGADGAHLRILWAGSNGDEWRLAAAVGSLADVLPQTRLVIGEGESTYDRNRLEKGGLLSYTREETAQHNKVVKAVKNAEQYGEALARGLEELEATAWLPLYGQGRILGSFIIYSRRRYFFTERWERIARAAADLAGTILLAKSAEFDRVRLADEMAWMIETVLSATEGSAEQALRSLVKRVCVAAGADVASLFAWYEAPKKLVLHTGYNWFQPMEGQAAYEIGEGWTGGVAEMEQEISIVSPSTDTKLCKKKYYDRMVPPEHRVPEGGSEARIGIRLTASDKLVGVLTLIYYRETTGRLVAEDQRITEFVKAVARLITLGLDVAKRVASGSRMRQLVGADKESGDLLLGEPGAERNWQSVVDALCRWFQVERVTLYWVQRDKKVQFGLSSQRALEAAAAEAPQTWEPFGAMGDVVLRRQALLIEGGSDPRLVRWPKNETVRALFAVPLFVGKGAVRGVLEFVNRLETTDHPFPFFDALEQDIAGDVAKTLAAVIEQRDHEKALDELASRLTTAAKIGASGLFGAIVMHQVMAPFANMRGSIDWLIRHPDSSEADRAKHLKRIEARVSEAVEIINHAAHRGAPGPQRVSLKVIVQLALRAVEPEMPFATTKLQVDNELSVFVNVDLWAIVGALVNLLSNAFEATKGTGVLTVATALSQDGRYALIRIHNTGSVVSSTEVARFFHAGFTTKSEQDHLGLGLSLAQQAIQDAGGTLDMTPISTGGVEVTVSLPINSQYFKADALDGVQP